MHFKSYEIKLYMTKRKVLSVAAIVVFGLLCFNVVDDDELTANEEDLDKKVKLNTNALSPTDASTYSEKINGPRRQPEYNAYAVKKLQKRTETNKKTRFTLKKFMKRIEELFPQPTFKADMILDMRNSCKVISYGGDKVAVESNSAFDVFAKSTKLTSESLQPDGLPILPDAISIITKKKLNIFVVPHHHSDLGWISTDDRYVSKENPHILNMVVDLLSRHHKRRFVWSDVALLSSWWDSATPERRIRLKHLVADGRLEIVTGGWAAMENTPNTHYYSMINQLIEGNEWLSRTLGVVVKNTWLLDPFGHTSTSAYLAHLMRSDSVVVQRISHNTKREMATDSSFEHRWRQSWDTRGTTQVLRHVMPVESYDSPNTCGSDPRICCQFDFFRLRGPHYNCPCSVMPLSFSRDGFVKHGAVLLEQFRKKANLFKTDTLLITLGDDYKESNPIEVAGQFDNYTDLFNYINTRPILNAKIQFGTMAEYFSSVRNDPTGSKMNSIPILTDDPLLEVPDTSLEDVYWKSYHVSRTYYKNLKRKLETQLRGTEIIFTMAFSVTKVTGMWPEFSADMYPLLNKARQTLALFQHDDASAIVDSNSRALENRNLMIGSIMDLKLISQLSVQILLARNRSSRETKANYFSFDEIFCEQTQIVKKKVIKLNSVVSTSHIVVYNSLTHRRSGVVSVYVSTPFVVVITYDRKAVQSQINLVWTERKIPRDDVYEVQFHVDIPPAGLETYMIRTDAGGGAMWAYSRQVSHVSLYNSPIPEALKMKMDPFSVVAVDNKKTIFIENEKMSASFSSESGFLQSVTNKRSLESTMINLDFVTYESLIAKDKSGVYRFFLVGPGKRYMRYRAKPVIRVIKGFLSTSIQVLLPDLLHQVTVFTTGKKNIGCQPLGLHVNNYVNTRKVADKNEITMRLETHIASGKEIFVDENGFQMRKRKYADDLPFSLNFHPITTMAYIEGKKRLSVLTEHPTGAASLEEGQMEVVLDRVVIQNASRESKHSRPLNRALHSFVILLESWGNVTRERTWKGLSYPSLAAHQLSWELLHPIVLMPRLATYQDKVLRRSIDPLRNAYVLWPCEAHLVNLRSRHSRDCEVPTTEAALVIHRVVADFSLDSAKHFKPVCRQVSVDDSLNLRKASLFSASDACHTSLNLQHDGRRLQTLYSSVEIDPMEIGTFKIVL